MGLFPKRIPKPRVFACGFFRATKQICPRDCVNNPRAVANLRKQADMTIVDHPEVTLSDKAMFSIWVEQSSPESCWEWTGRDSFNGYGRWYWPTAKKRVGAHRMAWMIENGLIPEGLVIDHKCHNTMCVNPSHLQAVTHKQNLENYGSVRAASGYRGVHKNGSGWRACVRHNYKSYLGPTRRTPEEANQDAVELRSKLFTNSLTDNKS